MSLSQILVSFTQHSLSDLQQKSNELIPTSISRGESDRDPNRFDRAVDRDISSLFKTHVENGEAWFKMEFGKIEFIHEVTIFTRFFTDWYNPWADCVSSIANFKTCIDESNNVDVSVYLGEVQQKSCGTLQMTYGLERADQIYKLLCNTEGDSVKLSKTTGDRIEFHEIVVTGRGLNFLYFVFYLPKFSVIHKRSFSSLIYDSWIQQTALVTVCNLG